MNHYCLLLHETQFKPNEYKTYRVPPQIFNRIVDVLPVNQRSAKYPGWVEAFRRQCQPCTEVGLRRHAARDRGFFRLACDRFCDTVRRQAELAGAASRGDDDKGWE